VLPTWTDYTSLDTGCFYENPGDDECPVRQHPELCESQWQPPYSSAQLCFKTAIDLERTVCRNMCRASVGLDSYSDFDYADSVVS